MNVKVAYLFGSLNRGGTETLLLDVFYNARINNLNAIGIYRKSGALENDFLESGITMKHLPTGGNVLTYVFNLRKEILKYDIQIVHAQQPIDAFYARLACLGTNIKVVLTFHGYDFNEGKLGRAILKYIINHTDANIFVSESQSQYYKSKYKLKNENQFVIYNGISFDKLDNFSNRSTATDHFPDKMIKDELHLKEETLLLGSIGNFVPGRDQFTLCRFLNLLDKNEVDFHFLFVGKKSDNNPQLYDDCYNFCKKNNLLSKITFLGTRNDVPSILRQLDSFFFATDHDTFGIAVVEAMAAGIPVFVNDWEVMNEITSFGKYATVYKTKDEANLLQEFMLFLQNRNTYQLKAKEAAKFSRELYSIEKHIADLKILYATILDF